MLGLSGEPLPRERPRFSPWRAASHGGLFLLGMLLVSVLAASALGLHPGFSESMGEAAVWLLVPVAAASWLAQTGRRAAARGVAAGVALVVVALLAAGIAGRGRIRSFAALAAAPLEPVDEPDGRRLRSRLGVSFRVPADSEPVEVDAAGPAGAESRSWRFERRSDGAVLLVSVAGVRLPDAAALESFAEGLADGARRGGVEVVPGRLVWEPARREATLAGELAGTPWRLRLVASPEGAARPLVVSIQALGRDGDLDDAVRSLRLE